MLHIVKDGNNQSNVRKSALHVARQNSVVRCTSFREKCFDRVRSSLPHSACYDKIGALVFLPSEAFFFN